MKTLLDKYQFILELRAREQRADRETIQTLARAFPGSLRELDLLAPADLDSRIAQLSTAAPNTAAPDTATPEWAKPMERYHENLRRILHAKRTRGSGDLNERERAELERLPRGSVSHLALAWTSAQTDLSAETLRALLWPLVP